MLDNSVLDQSITRMLLDFYVEVVIMMHMILRLEVIDIESHVFLRI